MITGWIVIPPRPKRIIVRIGKSGVVSRCAQCLIWLECLAAPVDDDEILVNRKSQTTPRRVGLLPNNLCLKILRTEDLIHKESHPVHFHIIKMHPDRTVVGKQLLHVQQPVAHHRQPNRVL